MNRYTLSLLLSALLLMILSSGCNDKEEEPQDLSRWVGEWTCYGDAMPQYYIQIVPNESAENRVDIINFGNLGEYPPNQSRPYGIIDGDVISVPYQDACQDGVSYVEGLGALVDDTHLYWETYSVNETDYSSVVFVRN